jgi:hypothetical protein
VARELLTVDVRSHGGAFSGNEEKWFRMAGLIVREYVSRCDFKGNWRLTVRGKVHQRNGIRCKFISVQAHSIRLRVRPAGNDSVFEYDLTPPTNYDAETAFALLQRYNEFDNMRTEIRIMDNGGKGGFSPEPVEAPPEPEPESPPPQVKEVPVHRAVEPHVNGTPATLPLPVQPVTDLLSTLKELMATAQRGESRRVKQEQLQSRRQHIQAEIDELRDELGRIEAEQLELLQQDEADGGDDVKQVLAGLQKLAAKRA